MYALIGHPLGHSMSPFIHEKYFKISGKKDKYELCDIAPENLKRDFLKVIDKYDGLNVTIPHKVQVIDFLDVLDKSAERYHAVNCIAKQDGKLVGYNTDCIGFLRSVPEDALGGKFLLLGCGGAGRMMALEAAAHNGNITIAIREADSKMAETLVSEIKEKFPKVNAEIVFLNKIQGKFDILCNSTPVGMYPNVEGCPVGEEVISNCENVFDAVYNPRETLLVKTAKKLNKNASGGMSMLVLQAQAAHEIWYGGSFTKEQSDKIISETSIAVEELFKQKEA